MLEQGATMADDGLVGTWRLTSWSARREDGVVTYPFGERAEGSLVYTAGGWMIAMLAASDRVSLSAGDGVGGSEAERAAAFSTYVAYCGTYEVEGDVVVHRVAMSLFPNWVGGEQKRYLELSGDELVLRMPPLEIEGKVTVNEFRWIREE
jgi:lipocalin-like protein